MSGSCFVAYSSDNHHHCHDHDNDGRCDEDDHRHHGPDTDSDEGDGPWTITGYAQLVPSTGAGWHPVHLLSGITGVVASPEVVADPGALFELGAQVIAANPELVGLPDWAGDVAPIGVEHLSWGVRAHWAQLRQGARGWRPLPGAGVVLEFALNGRLVGAQNRLVLAP